MTEDFLATDEDQAGNELIDSPTPRLTYLLPALVLAVLAVVVVGGYFVYQRLNGTTLGFLARPARIAFMSDRDGNWEIYIMDRDGSNLLNLTNDPSADGVPIHTADQDRLAFVSDRDGEELDLFLVNLDGSNATNITNTPDSNEVPIAWSPNGEHLVFVSDRSGSSEVFLMKTSGEELLNLSQRDEVNNFDDWSSKTDRFILAANADMGTSLFITDLTGSTHQPLTDGNYPAGGARWSPDGQKITFMAIMPDSDSIDIYMVDAVGGEPVNLTQSPSNDGFPLWSPDGSRIAFLSDRDDNQQIYVMDADGSNQTNLTNSLTDEAIQGDFAWSPDGTQILFHSSRDGNVEVYLMNADGSASVNLTNSPGTDFGAIWVE